MTNNELFYYIIALVAMSVFTLLLFRSKADVDYLQETKEGKVINSSTRIGFFLLLGFVIWYCAFQTVHFKEISEAIVLLFLAVAFGGKAGIDFLKGKQDKQ